ncbi:MAG: hypothetical protein ACE5GZ_12330 [Gammaproteobacteria bacterium]
MKIAGALLFAFIAALGNALFVAGQKKAVGIDNGLGFIVYAVAMAFVLILMTVPLIGTPNYLHTVRASWVWVIVGGVGLCMTYIGFNLLYTYYGASYYILFAVMSIITTTVIVGVIFFRESLNIFHWSALLFALITVALFSIGSAKG